MGRFGLGCFGSWAILVVSLSEHALVMFSEDGMSVKNLAIS